MAAHFMIGQRVGDYLINDLLGEGGMGVVFRGVQERLGQVVAIKMLHPSLMADERLKSRFVREAKALARLNHPNVVRLLNFVNQQDNCFIVMEYAPGTTIDGVITAHGVIPERQAAEYYVQILAAMHYAHSLGIIHRDIKPSNISVDNTGLVKIFDFGTAKILGEQRLTQEGMTLGTLIYMSPEQICGRELDHRSDIYSLGVMLYEMVTANLPHFCEDEMRLVREIAQGTPDPPTRYNPRLDPAFETIIMRSIAKDPRERFQTADEFLKAINGYLQGHRRKDAKSTPDSGVMTPAIGGGHSSSSFVPNAVANRRDSSGVMIALAVTLLFVGVGVGVAGIVTKSLPTGVAYGVIGGAVGLAAIAGLFAFRRGGAPSPEPAVVPEESFGEATLAVDEADVRRQISVMQGQEVSPQPRNTERDEPVPAQLQQQLVGQAGPTAYLYVLIGPDQGRSWPIPLGAVTIGRGPHNTIILSDQGCSTTHAQISFDGQGFLIADLQSRNGVYVNNQRIHSSPLRDRDSIVVGNSRLAFSQPQAQ